ncbi:serine hydrolase domain-containing protein [Sandaracinus amylolyticus]|uniref:serine hydrolase domain-containing protein n=1 Tax=Sandaracinus amylolyticus TaxID=927083 RepID=UPI001F259A8C|nr:serine hydrolase domain-containing protein [Sandaracinus amylolyticus]UJR79506.1 Beta-lactamase class C -like penicillin binding proteins [Sandaracinus amylolyticus]
MAAGVTGTVFPGATACLSWRSRDGELEWAEASAGTTGGPGAKPVADDTPFDLASLTKPLVSTIALRLVARGAISFDTRADALMPDARGTPGGAATLEQLLTHRSGLAPWGGLYLDVPHDPGTSAARRWILAEACRRPDEGAPGRAVYSDLGYMIAGEMLARASGRDLDDLLKQEVVRPLGIAEDQMMYAGALAPDRRADLARRCAATERDDWRGVMVRGEVHDENCAALGGVAGHAGVFASARAMATFGRAYLDSRNGKVDFLAQEIVGRALQVRPGGTHRLGWDGKSPENSAAGKRMSLETFGHLGFTGTSIYCDPTRDLVVVLLTNRVCPSRANEKIKGFRPAFHDGVVAVIDG